MRSGRYAEAEHPEAAAEPADDRRAAAAATCPSRAEPAFVRAFADAPVPATAPVVAAGRWREPRRGRIDGPTTDLPEGFDLSKFGPHVQAAYKGPTEDNPSLSLKYRLRRAAALDQMARKASPSLSRPSPPRLRPAPANGPPRRFRSRP